MRKVHLVNGHAVYTEQKRNLLRLRHIRSIIILCNGLSSYYANIATMQAIT